MEMKSIFQRFFHDGFWSIVIGGAIYFFVHRRLYSIASVVAILFALILVRYVYVLKVRTEMANGKFATRFVHIENDGTVRTLNQEELNYLNTEFHGADGARP